MPNYIHDDILDKCRKILSLAEHPNTPEHESAAAWRALDKLLLKHNLDQADIRAHKSNEAIVEHTILTVGRLATRDRVLISSLCLHFACEFITSSRCHPKYEKRCIVIGHKRHVDLVRFFFLALPVKIRLAFWRICSLKRIDRDIPVPKQFMKEYTSFLFGYCAAFAHPPQAFAPSAGTTSEENALMVIHGQELDAYMTEHNPNIKVNNRCDVTLDPEFYAAGHRAGKQENFALPITEGATP